MSGGRRSGSSKVAVAGVLLAGILALTGCASREAALARIDCVTDADCGGRTCVAGNCEAPELEGLASVHLELAPPSGSPYVTTHVLGLSLADPSRPLALTLPAPAALEVQVFDADGADGTPGRELDASIALAGSARIPGRELALDADLRAYNRRTQSVRLLEGEYGVLIRRLDGMPSLDTRFTVRAPSGGLVQKEFHFERYRHIHGEVTSAVSRDTKLSGVRIVAYSTRTGLPSTSTTSDALGRYSIELPDTEDSEFRLLGTRADGDQPAWGFEEVVLVERGRDREKQIPLEPTSASLKGRARIRLGGHVEGEGFVPAAEARVTLTATTTENLKTRVYEVYATTDRDGYVTLRGGGDGGTELPLLRGRYTLSVVPRGDSPFGRLVKELDLTSVGPAVTADVQEILPRKLRVLGSVRSSLGRPVPFATVELQELGVEATPVQVATDATGAFEARVEAGDYLLLVRPSSHSDVNEVLPVAAERLTLVGDGTEALVTISLPRAVSVYGAVRGALDGMPVPDTGVELFVELDGAVVSLGGTRTDTAGGFEMIVPALWGEP